MKKLFLWFFLPLTLVAQEPDDALFTLENAPSPFFPFALSGSYVDVRETHFRTPGIKDKKLKYRQWETAFAYTHPFSQYCGLIFGAGYIGTEVDMEDNPAFHQTFFNYVNLSVGAFTKAFPDWTWTLTAAAYLDTEEFSLIDYTLYQGVLWGRYNVCEYVELDFGMIVEAGLRKEKVWPILGFVYFPRDNWRLSAIYPIDISLEYDFSACWTLGASIRFLRNRHRVKQEEPLSQAIFEYRTAGAECDLTYEPFARLSVTGFAGSTFNGDLEIADRSDKNTSHFKFKGSFYAGASLILGF